MSDPQSVVPSTGCARGAAAGVHVTVWGGMPPRWSAGEWPPSDRLPPPFLLIGGVGALGGRAAGEALTGWLAGWWPDAAPGLALIGYGVGFVVAYALAYVVLMSPKCVWPWDDPVVLEGAPVASTLTASDPALAPVGAVVLSRRGVDHIGRSLRRSVRPTVPWSDVAHVHIFGRGARSEDRGVRIVARDGRVEVWRGSPRARVVGVLTQLGATIEHHAAP